MPNILYQIVTPLTKNTDNLSGNHRAVVDEFIKGNMEPSNLFTVNYVQDWIGKSKRTARKVVQQMLDNGLIKIYSVKKGYRDKN